MDNNISSNSSMEDISSFSAKPKTPEHKKTIKSSAKSGVKKVSKATDAYANLAHKNLGNIIKVIAFIFAFGIIIASLIAAFLIFSLKVTYAIFSLLIVIFGVFFAAIVFFPIYGLGHVICQNNEILKRLKRY